MDISRLWRSVLRSQRQRRNHSVGCSHTDDESRIGYLSGIHRSAHRRFLRSGAINRLSIANLSHLSDIIVLGIENMLKSDSEATVCLKDIAVKNCIDYGDVFVFSCLLKKLF